jgi:hypothetical protein
MNYYFDKGHKGKYMALDLYGFGGTVLEES